MNNEIQMSVSSMTRSGDKKAIYIMFQDGEKSAEYSLPECGLVRNKGFSEAELSSLKEYVDNERDSIYAMAKGVNPLKALMRDV
ncbi:MAG: hypothetical protein K6G24_09020 [Lachnospiraceae bacterium]|nr:hypothetical protein [Lachnospiraceae bacterium]